MNGRVLCVHTPYCVCTHNIAVIHEKLWHTHTYVYIDTYINGHVLCVHTPYCVCTHNIAVMQETLSSYLRKFITSEIPFFFFQVMDMGSRIAAHHPAPVQVRGYVTWLIRTHVTWHVTILICGIHYMCDVYSWIWPILSNWLSLMAAFLSLRSYCRPQLHRCREAFIPCVTWHTNMTLSRCFSKQNKALDWKACGPYA